MDQTTLIIGAVVIIVLITAAFLMMQRRRTAHLKSTFGPEYDRAVRDAGDKRKAEADLQSRQKRVEKLDLRPLTPAQRDTFRSDWDHVQAEFVDDPEQSIGDADTLLQEVMAARGYPVKDFDQAAEDISVDHPSVVQHYRTAHDIVVRHQEGDGDTEDLRNAMINYRALFDELVADGAKTEPKPEVVEERHDRGTQKRVRNVDA